MEFNESAISRRLGGDSRSTQGIMSRGANVYSGGSASAPGAGRPPETPLPPMMGGQAPQNPGELTPPPMKPTPTGRFPIGIQPQAPVASNPMDAILRKLGGSNANAF